MLASPHRENFPDFWYDGFSSWPASVRSWNQDLRLLLAPSGVEFSTRRGTFSRKNGPSAANSHCQPRQVPVLSCLRMLKDAGSSCRHRICWECYVPGPMLIRRHTKSKLVGAGPEGIACLAYLKHQSTRRLIPLPFFGIGSQAQNKVTKKGVGYEPPEVRGHVRISSSTQT